MFDFTCRAYDGDLFEGSIRFEFKIWSIGSSANL